MQPSSIQSDRVLPGTLGQAGRRSKKSPEGSVPVITGPELVGLAIFCALGLLLTAAFNLVVPDFAEVAASLQPLF